MKTPPPSPETRLASYGTLAPGRVNAHQLDDLKGQWRSGTVRGHLTQAGWGVHLGFPGLVLDPAGDTIDVQIFDSPDLPAHWDRLDAFESEAYRRVVTGARTEHGEVAVSVYVVLGEGET